jgi:hypothetical protein
VEHTGGQRDWDQPILLPDAACSAFHEGRPVAKGIHDNGHFSATSLKEIHERPRFKE